MWFLSKEHTEWFCLNRFAFSITHTVNPERKAKNVAREIMTGHESLGDLKALTKKHMIWRCISKFKKNKFAVEVISVYTQACNIYIYTSQRLQKIKICKYVS